MRKKSSGIIRFKAMRAMLKGHTEPILSPLAFDEATAANPDLVLPKMARFYQGIAPLPRIDRAIFDRLFAALFGEKPPADNPADGNDTWIQYVQPWDLSRIARTDRDPARALVMLRHRVEDRLSRVTPHHGPSLADLHGLGEARIRAETLITDIQAAVSGEIPWGQVDRGMLLAGPPGCGKTALARAIAKDCGIRFSVLA